MIEPDFEAKYLNVNGEMTVGAYRELELTHDIEWRKGYVFFKSRSRSRPNLEFFKSNLPAEIVSQHEEKK